MPGSAASMSMEFSADARSVAAARSFVRERLDDAEADVRDVALLLVSELATNAVKHAGTAFTVGIDRTDGRVRVTVTDQSDGVPVMARAFASEIGGRGLTIVDRLASDWGFDRGPTGTCVWFELDAVGGRRVASLASC